MNKTVHIDQAGRVVLPKPLRERFRLQGGDTLAVEVTDDCIHLRPQKVGFRLVRINGVLVLSDSTGLPEGDLVAESRNERIDELVRATNKAE
jgi:AbrB family looped-hinge helix DNA binding protein